MKRNLAHSELARHTRPRAAQPSGINRGPQADASALEALSAASDQYDRGGGPERQKGRKPNLTISLIAALIVGAAVALAGRSEHRCTAMLQVTGHPDCETIASHAAALLDHAWQHSVSDPGGDEQHAQWSVDAPSPTTLRLILITRDSAFGLEQIRQVAEGYVAAVRAEAQRSSSTPGAAESALAAQAEELGTWAQEARARINAAREVTRGTPDPRQARAALLGLWQAQRSSFAAIRSQVEQATAELARLKGESAPTSGIITGKERKRAVEANTALEQDGRELTVQATELKLHLLNVWQASAGPLEQLAAAVDNLQTTIAGHETAQARQGTERGDGPLLASLEPYSTEVEAFAEVWNRGFTRLKQLKPADAASETLELHPRLRTRLHDFLFRTARHLAAMRTQTQALSAGAADDARYHVFESDLTRAFRTVQAAHHRFEFAAGGIEPLDNFRLDAALQGARGLHRRTVQQRQRIEERLQILAVERAQEQWQQAKQDADRLVARLRGSGNQSITKLLALQEELNESASLTQEFLAAAVPAQLAAARLESIQSAMESVNRHLSELALERASAAASSSIELVSCSASSLPTNLRDRLRSGGVGAALALVALLLCQWWITRRP